MHYSIPSKIELLFFTARRPSIQNTSGATKESVSEPGWKSLAREKTRAFQPFLSRLATNPSPVHPSPPPAPPAQPPKPSVQPKTQPLTTAVLHPLKTQHTLNTPIQPASQRPTTKPAPSGTKDKQVTWLESTEHIL